MSETERLLDDTQTSDEAILYKRRWLMAFLIGLQNMIMRFFMNSIGIVNNVYAEYFDATIIAVDWLTIIQYPGCIIANILIALLIYSDKVGLRKLSIVVSACTIFTCSAFLLASLFPFLYPLLYCLHYNHSGGKLLVSRKRGRGCSAVRALTGRSWSTNGVFHTK